MKIKLDEKLARVPCREIGRTRHDADTVPREHLGGRPDAAIWEAAQRESRFLVTQDLDFSDMRRYLPGTHADLMVVRLSDPSRDRLLQRVLAVFDASPTDLNGTFVVVTDRKVRVKRQAHPGR